MLQGLIAAARNRNIKLRIVNNVERVPSNDTVNLVNAGLNVLCCTVSWCCKDYDIRTLDQEVVGSTCRQFYHCVMTLGKFLTHKPLSLRI